MVIIVDPGGLQAMLSTPGARDPVTKTWPLSRGLMDVSGSDDTPNYVIEVAVSQPGL
jgi:hypothetical protein